MIIIAIIGIVSAGSGITTWLLLPKSPPSNNSAPSSNNQPAKPAVVATPISCVEKLPTDIKIGQKLMFAAYSDRLATETPLLAASKVGGIIVMDQIDKASLDAYTASMAIKPTIATDQEGGTVQRYKTEGTLPGATDTARTLTTQQAYAQYLKDAQYLKSVGITTNFAPVVDVMRAEPSPLPGRMFSTDPATVVSYATQAIKASSTAGVTPVIKHFPGLGSSSGNTDFGPATTESLDVLKTRDLIPYQQLSPLRPDVMIANVTVPGLTDGQPAVWSAAALSLLRSYGYQNSVTYTDSLTARAVPGTLEDAAVKSWQAGVDVALIVQTRQQTADLQQYLSLITTRATNAVASGELSADSLNQSVLRILMRKGVNPCEISM